MRKIFTPYFFTFTFCVTLAFYSTTQAQSDPNRWQQRIRYQIQSELLDAKHQAKTFEKITYINNSPDTLRVLYVHLFYNAFQPHSKYSEKAAMDDDEALHHRVESLDSSRMGFQKINSVTQSGDTCLTELDNTILKIFLLRPALPKDSVQFEISTLTQFPYLIRRAGFRNREGVRYSAAQWYPKVAEYDYEGWHPDPYLGREFYGVWGDFDVSLTLPAAFTVGATGHLVNADSIGHGYSKTDSLNKKKYGKDDVLTWHFVAHTVHDFAWAADKNFIYADTLAVLENADTVKLHFVYLPSVAERWREMKTWSADIVKYYSATFGHYPYPDFTLAQAGDGGMEYPQIVFLTGFRSRLNLAGVTAHEMGHNWYYGLMANNETKYAWLDEGFTSYLESRWMDKYFGFNNSDDRTPFEDWLLQPNNSRQSLFRGYYRISKSGLDEPVMTHSDRFREASVYGANAYNKGALCLVQLQYIVGDSVFDKLMKRHFEKWHFKHPNATDFERTAEEVSGMELDWFFDEWLRSTKTIDYAVQDFSEKYLDSLKKYVSSVTLERRGEAIMPIDLAVYYQDGTSQRYTIPLDVQLQAKTDSGFAPLKKWNWVARTYTTTFTTDKEIDYVEIDPSLRMADLDRTNNRTGSKRFLLQFLKQPELVPPLDRYAMSVRPSVWYGDNSGLRLGGILTGSYMNYEHKMELGLWLQTGTLKDILDYNSKAPSSNTQSPFLAFDYEASYKNPVSLFGNNTTLSMEAYRFYGIREERFSVVKNFTTKVYQPTPNIFRIDFEHQVQSIVAFTSRNFAWGTPVPSATYNDVIGYGSVGGSGSPVPFALSNDAGTYDVKMSFSHKHPEDGFRAEVSLESGLFMSENQYSKLKVEAYKEVDLTDDLTLGVRIFAGGIWGNAPIQKLFYASAASPEEQYRNDMYRSYENVSARLADNLNFTPFGGGGLSGYSKYYFETASSSIIAANYKVEFSNPFLLVENWVKIPVSTLPVIPDLRTSAFYSVATSLDNLKGTGISSAYRTIYFYSQNRAYDLLQEAGVEVAYTPFAKWMQSASYFTDLLNNLSIVARFPIWLSEPNLTYTPSDVQPDHLSPPPHEANIKFRCEIGLKTGIGF
jgi:hypothetical protein